MGFNTGAVFTPSVFTLVDVSSAHGSMDLMLMQVVPQPVLGWYLVLDYVTVMELLLIELE